MKSLYFTAFLIALITAACDTGGATNVPIPQYTTVGTQATQTIQGLDLQTYTQGSRILTVRAQAVTWQAQDGASVTTQPHAVGFYDTNYSITCSIQKSADGHMRCLPPVDQSILATATINNTPQYLYVDPACTQIWLWSAQSGCTSSWPSITSIPIKDICGTVESYKIYQVTQGQISAVYGLSNGSCLQASTYNPPLIGNYLVELSATNFVEFTANY